MKNTRRYHPSSPPCIKFKREGGKKKYSRVFVVISLEKSFQILNKDFCLESPLYIFGEKKVLNSKCSLKIENNNKN